MATFSGVGGDVRVGTAQVLEINNWDCTVEQAMLKTTKFGMGGWRTQMASERSWSGKFSGSYDPTDATGQMALLGQITAATPAVVVLHLKIDNTHEITGNAWIKAVGVKDSAEGIAEVDFTFDGDGTPTIN